MSTAVQHERKPPSPGAGFAAWVREEMARQGKRQADLHRALGWERAEISRLVKGYYKNPEPEKVEAVCRALGRPVAEALIAMGYSREAVQPSMPKLAAPLLDLVREFDQQQQEALAQIIRGFIGLARQATEAKLIDVSALMSHSPVATRPPPDVDNDWNIRSKSGYVRQRVPRPGEPGSTEGAAP